MRIALVAPNAQAHTVVQPLGLGYLAASIRQDGHEVRIFDLARDDSDPETGARAAASWKPDLLGVSVLSTTFLSAREFLAEFRRLSPGVKVIAGGPHVTSIPSSFSDLGADLGMVGESELSLRQLAASLEKGDPLEDVPGLCRRENGSVVVNPQGERVYDLDALGFPAWDLMDPGTYPDKPSQILHQNFPVAIITTSRGCAYDCSFCASTTLWGKRLRWRSPEDVVDEIELLVGEYGVQEIHFMDDSFTQKASHARAVCEEILRRGIRTSWACTNGVRIDSLDDGLLGLMRSAGCFSVGLGLESGSQRVLDLNRKKLDLSLVPERVRMIKSHGIATHGFFIIGLPGETRETVRETLKLSRSLSLDRANFTLMAPLPGSDLYRKYIEEAGKEPDYESFKFFTPFPVGEMSTRELKRWQRRAVFGFYLRPRQVWNTARSIRMSQLRDVFRTVMDYTWRYNG
ncbi:MAG: B12-binding domain-containing radical SAM protein [Thermoleophilia bacterium]|nr:B12-binding domain-containing radical SAM protein [Thermoleophilia bacterium]